MKDHRPMLETLSGSDTRGKTITLPVSLALHAIVLAALIVLPVLGSEDLPEPATKVLPAFLVHAAPPPPPPAPPPPPPRAAPAKPVTRMPARPRPRSTPRPVFRAPVEVRPLQQSDLFEELRTAVAVPALTNSPGASAAGVEGGVPGGVEGGVMGGAMGGAVGGVPGGVPMVKPPATMPPKKPVRVGGQIRAPRKLRNVPPEYPDIARSARVEGVVILEATIDVEGRVKDVEVLRAHPLLERAAVVAVRDWVYSPTLLNGVAVPVVMTVTVQFRLG